MLFDVAVVFLFVGFALVAGLIWPKMLNDRVSTETKALLATFPAIQQADFARVLDKGADESGYRDYIVPTIMFVVIVLMGTMLLVVSTTRIDVDRYDILGGALTGEPAKAQAVRAMLMVQSAFLGAFLWSLQYLLRRAQARDIAPTAIYRICLYMLFGMVLAIFVNHLSQDGSFFLDDVTGAKQILPVLGFMTGYFSVEIFEKVTDHVMRRRQSATAVERPPGLTTIEGISYDTSMRLRELWLDDAYALAHSNPIEIYLKTPFGLESCIDWVAQAQLLVRAKAEGFEFLRTHGVRSILEFDALVRTRSADGRTGFDKLLDSLTFSDAQANLKAVLASLGLHAAEALDADLTFRRLRQLVTLLYPGRAAQPPPPPPPPAVENAEAPPAQAEAEPMPA